MSQQAPQFQSANVVQSAKVVQSADVWRARALRLFCVMAMGVTLAACGRCGDFLSSSQGQIGACHSDSPRQ
jgi:hypothetical protein